MQEDAESIINHTSQSILLMDNSYQGFDMHCHVDFAYNPQALAQEAQHRNIGLFSGTVSPRGYQRAVNLLGLFPNVRVGLGLHPWWITQETLEDNVLEEFLSLLPSTRYLNEIGLDFTPRFSMTKDIQVGVFKRTMCALAANSGGSHVLSLHSVKATDVMLDLLEESGVLQQTTCIFHWFSGSSNDLNRAIKNGCYFSVGERFLATKRGREYLKAIPWKQLLLETDLPAESTKNKNEDFAIFSSLQTAQKLVQELKRN